MKLERCPLCGRPARFVSPVVGVWNISCDDDRNNGCGLVLFGSGGKQLKKEVGEIWNTRNHDGVIPRERSDSEDR